MKKFPVLYEILCSPVCLKQPIAAPYPGPVTGRSVRHSPPQTSYFYKEGKESDNRGELKKDKVCWKSSKRVEKRSKVK